MPTNLKIVGSSKQAGEIRDFAALAAKSEHTVLLLGETGTGKDHLAELIHDLGRQDRAFVPVDCGALSEDLSESELFGHAQGAFTGARQNKQGLVTIAEGGTIFFNEVANMPLLLQATFLRILDKKSFRVVGGIRETPVNTRIIAATNADLELAMRRGTLRPDLYYRLCVIPFTLSSLRERREDIQALAEYFLRQEHGTKNFSPEAMAMLKEYHWPGNLRELKNVVRRAVFLSKQEEIGPECVRVRPCVARTNGVDVESKPDPAFPNGVEDSEKFPTLRETEVKYLQTLLEKTNWNVKKSAEISGVAIGTMYNKIRRYKLQAARERQS